MCIQEISEEQTDKDYFLVAKVLFLSSQSSQEVLIKNKQKHLFFHQ